MSFGENCPRFKKEFGDVYNSQEIQQFNDNHTDVYNYIKENSGMNLTDLIYDSTSLYDILLVEVSICKIISINTSRTVMVTLIFLYNCISVKVFDFYFQFNQCRKIKNKT